MGTQIGEEGMGQVATQVGGDGMIGSWGNRDVQGRLFEDGFSHLQGEAAHPHLGGTWRALSTGENGEHRGTDKE